MSTNYNSWSAICRGAVVQGITRSGFSTTLSVEVEARIARASYGTFFADNWNSATHSIEDKYWCNQEKAWKANNQIKWFLRQVWLKTHIPGTLRRKLTLFKGDDITTQSPVQHGFYELLDKPVPKMTCDLYFSAALPPPSRKDHTVQKLCTITWAQTIDIEMLPTWTNPIGKVYSELEYDLEMTCEQGTVDFAIYFRGNRVGGRNVQVDFY